MLSQVLWVLGDNEKNVCAGQLSSVFFKKAGESIKLLSRQSQELGFRTLLISLASDNNLDLTASPVTAMISSEVLNALGNCLVQAAF